MVKILIAPDKFKGSLSAVEACAAIEKGLRKYGGGVEMILHPMADGGEGTLDVLGKYMLLQNIAIEVADPLFRSISVFYKKNNKTAYVEMAAASGLQRLKENERNCLYTTTYGTGEMIRHAVENGARKIYLFVGGSATND
ncbi:MAG TPA: glycerate kinase, partial [Bacteroidetes bacterium]|nr:glycerate kinase [Bacteroidota bacterium]